MAHIAEPDRFFHRIAEPARRQIPHRLAIAEYRFPPEQHTIRLGRKRRKHALERCLALGHQRRASQKVDVLAKLHRKAESRLERR